MSAQKTSRKILPVLAALTLMAAGATAFAASAGKGDAGGGGGGFIPPKMSPGGGGGKGPHAGSGGGFGGDHHAGPRTSPDKGPRPGQPGRPGPRAHDDDWAIGHTPSYETYRPKLTRAQRIAACRQDVRDEWSSCLGECNLLDDTLEGTRDSDGPYGNCEERCTHAARAGYRKCARIK